MKEANTKKKLIYVMGCGRSGSTILGVALGNGRGCLDLGEAVDFLKRGGIPNSYGPETETGQFWATVTNCMVDRVKNIFDKKLAARLTSLEHPRWFPFTYFGINRRSTLLHYSEYVNSLYGCISANSADKSVYIDSSKYPGRALLLTSELRDFDVRVLHLVRHPVKAIEAFGDERKRDDQGYKGFIAATFYYFVTNLFCFAVRLRVGGDRYLKIRYEDFLNTPNETLATIASKFRMDLRDAIEKIESNKPLRKGFIFNGNRMSMGKESGLTLKKSENLASSRTLKNTMTMLINRVWY